MASPSPRDVKIEVADALIKLGAAWRGDWSEFDGRTLRHQLNMLADALINDTHKTATQWCAEFGIDPETGGWEGAW